MTNTAMEDFVRWCEGKLAKSRDQLSRSNLAGCISAHAPSEDAGRTSRARN